MECFAEYFSERWPRIKNDVLLTFKSFFPLLGTNLKGLLSKISLKIHQSYKKGRRYSKHGFLHGEHVFVSTSFEQFETVWLDKQHSSDCSFFSTYHLVVRSNPFWFILFFVYFVLIHAIDSLPFNCYRKLNYGG